MLRLLGWKFDISKMISDLKQQLKYNWNRVRILLSLKSASLNFLFDEHFNLVRQNDNELELIKQQEIKLALTQKQNQKNYLIMFYSNNCSLCSSLQQFVQQLSRQNDKDLDMVKICVDDEQIWVPEMLQYNIDYVPCFVACKKGSGVAIGKTGQPKSKQFVIDGVKELVQSLQ
eukprot:TRINITY_DN2220_c1_g1_i1.p1 TRINITY_DN2220_c1_g1~~TRINITY_DN2220_c1_g1_i1.p1  ORF type:complete len:173 (-),score=10.23 TRINITY_DN2220_c1_g1_i1:46-564(-)